MAQPLEESISAVPWRSKVSLRVLALGAGTTNRGLLRPSTLYGQCDTLMIVAPVRGGEIAAESDLDL